MTNTGVAIRYGDVAPEAKENFVPFASESEFGTLAQLQQYNLNFPNYANPCELYSVLLDGKAEVFPSDPENENMGLWSEQVSNDDGIFTEPIVLDLESEGQYTSQGLTLTFDTYNNIFPTLLNIKWIRKIEDEETVLSDKDFTPDSAFYFCRNLIENYNKIVITFFALNMPQNRLKLHVIDYGYQTFFYGDELRGVKLIQEIDPISTEISINTADFTLDSRRDTEFSFQEKQPLAIYFNGKLQGTTFVNSAKRKSKNLWQIQSEDYIGLMDSTQYYGGMYSNANAVDILADIFTVAKVPYSIDEVFANETVTGYIPYTTCRDALMQVAFAIQAVVDTSNSEVVKVFALEDDVKQTIPLSRIMQGQNFVDNEKVTSVEVASHTYKAIAETVDVYDANESGAGENIFVKFGEPLHNLTITNGEIIESGTNFAIINAEASCVLQGKRYEHSMQLHRKKNAVTLASQIEKTVAIENATLVSQNNVAKILEKCYNFLTTNNEINLKIVEGKHIIETESGAEVTYDKEVLLGDVVEAETEYLGTKTVRILSAKYSLNGGIKIKECKAK